MRRARRRRSERGNEIAIDTTPVDPDVPVTLARMAGPSLAVTTSPDLSFSRRLDLHQLNITRLAAKLPQENFLHTHKRRYDENRRIQAGTGKFRPGAEIERYSIRLLSQTNFVSRMDQNSRPCVDGESRTFVNKRAK